MRRRGNKYSRRGGHVLNQNSARYNEGLLSDLRRHYPVHAKVSETLPPESQLKDDVHVEDGTVEAVVEAIGLPQSTITKSLELQVRLGMASLWATQGSTHYFQTGLGKQVFQYEVDAAIGILSSLNPPLKKAIDRRLSRKAQHYLS